LNGGQPTITKFDHQVVNNDPGEISPTHLQYEVARLSPSQHHIATGS